MSKQVETDYQFDPERVRDISEAVYRERLGSGEVAAMIEKDGDGGKRLRSRAGSYDVLTRVYLRVIGENATGGGR